MKQDAKEHFAQIAATFFDTLDENGLTVSDFSYGKTGVCSYFIKLRDGLFDDENSLADVLCQPWRTSIPG